MILFSWPGKLKEVSGIIGLVLNFVSDIVIQEGA